MSTASSKFNNSNHVHNKVIFTARYINCFMLNVTQLSNKTQQIQTTKISVSSLNSSIRNQYRESKIMIYLDASNRSCKRLHCDRVQQRTKLPDDDLKTRSTGNL